MADLTVHLAGMRLENPVMPAAGPPVRDGNWAHRAKEGGAGAIVTKTVSSKAAKVPRPCMADLKRGFLNAELWSELSIEHWQKEEYPKVKETGLPIIVGLGYTKDDIRALAPKVAPFADALELSTHYLGADPTPVVEAIQAAKESCDLPVFVKLSPQIPIPHFATCAKEAGASGLVLINSVGPCLDIDIATGRPLMGSLGGYGWLSGAAIFPLALRAVYDACHAVDLPVIGVGGIRSGIDALKMIMVGATAVQVCTEAILRGPSIYGKIVKEMKAYMEQRGIKDLAEIRGTALQVVPEENLVPSFPRVNPNKCVACGFCMQSCAYEAISIDAVAEIDTEKCFGCGLCVTRCAPQAISLD